MIITRTGNLLDAGTDALVNPVNTVGIMGAGLARQFKRAFPANFAHYAEACSKGDVKVGQMYVVSQTETYPCIINFPTKAHWRQPSKLQYVTDGLADLASQVRLRGITSIAIPSLGCGLGGLTWEDVRPLICAAFANLPDVAVHLYEPTDRG